MKRTTMAHTVFAAAFVVVLPLLSASAQEGPPKPRPPAISAEFRYEHKFVEVFGSRVAYVEVGEGSPILFIHGNPTSSYLWRNVLPHVEGQGRVIAIDLIGMGKSDKPDIDYRFSTHARYLDGFIDALDLKDITLVVHDWGSALGMDYARRHPGNVEAIAFMEAIVAPAMPIPSYEAMGEGPGEFFRNVRTQGVGEEMILENNMFVESIMPKMGVVRTLSEAEMNAYRAPFPTPASRKPSLVWPREIPIGGEPKDVTAIIQKNGEWLHETDIAKLFLYTEPGAFGTPEVARYFAENLENIETHYLGVGTHYIQEDHPHEIGRAIADWLRRLK